MVELPDGPREVESPKNYPTTISQFEIRHGSLSNSSMGSPPSNSWYQSASF